MRAITYYIDKKFRLPRKYKKRLAKEYFIDYFMHDYASYVYNQQRKQDEPR